MDAFLEAGAKAKPRIAVLGAGKLGTVLIQAFLKRGVCSREAMRATVQHDERARHLRAQLQIPVSTDNPAAAREADIVLVSVKPSAVQGVMEQIAPALSSAKLIISTAASVATQYIEASLRVSVPVIRAMPNMPCMVGEGMTGLSAGRYASASHLELARRLFETVGKVVIVDERHMDAVTGLSASGPAFIYIILESLAEAGVKVGLPRDVATLLSAQTALGSARMVLETGDHPALLKDAVTTPAGCTIDGIMALEDGKLRVTLIKAVVKATRRAKQLLMEAGQV